MHRYGYLILGVIGGIALGFNIGRMYGIRTGRQIAETNRQVSMGPKVEVVAAATDISVGTALVRRHLGKMTVFSSSVRNTIRPEDAHLILGRKVLFTIRAREPILWGDIEGRPKTGNQQPVRGDSETRAEDGTASGAPQP